MKFNTYLIKVPKIETNDHEFNLRLGLCETQSKTLRNCDFDIMRRLLPEVKW